MSRSARSSTPISVPIGGMLVGKIWTLDQDRINISGLHAGDGGRCSAANELDLPFWNSVKDSCRREELQAYLDQHPNGHFAALARLRLASPEVT